MFFQKRFFKALLIVLALLFLSISSAVAQSMENLESFDFENLRASEVSEEQLEQLWDRAQEEGYSISEIEQMAIARGAPRSEVSTLISRLREVRLQSSDGDSDNDGEGQLRSVEDMENLSAEQDTTREDTLRDQIFGMDMFRDREVNFTPSMNIPTPSNYQLGPGDELVIDIWGAAEQNYQETISPEGTISISGLGPIHLNGLTIEEARERLTSSLANIYSGLEEDEDGIIDTFARISLGNVRSIKVTVLGEARTPGTYTLPSLATVFNALYSAGGPANNGTFRKIDVIRGDSVATSLDIYDFLVYGDQSDNIRLRDNDIIKIDPYMSRAEVDGETKREGLFELKPDETIDDLITFAGGFTDDAYKKRINVVSNTEDEKRIDDIDYPEERDFKLNSGSVVRVDTVLDRFENRVEIDGAVFRPGAYALNDTTTLHSVIERAEGIREDAFMNRGLIFREQDDLTTEAIPFSVRDVVNNPEEHDIPLQKNDVIRISSIFDLREDYNVEIVGAVQDPGEFDYADNMTLEDIIFQADGFRESAVPYRIEVSRRVDDSSDSAYVSRETAEIHRFTVDEDLELNEEDADFTLQPFDKVYVRSSPSYKEQEDVTIDGEVLFPGEYTIDERDMRISDLIERAGGLNDYAYVEGANLTRQIDDDQEVDTSFVNLAGEDTLQQEDLASGENKVGIDLAEIMENPGSKDDLILREGDVLEIPKELETVRMAGGVIYPVIVRYEDNKSMKDYIRSAGGVTENGKRKDAYVVYANGEVDRARRFLFFRNYPDIRPGATIYVPEEEPEPGMSAQERVALLSAIVSIAATLNNIIN